jgi:hypothetical protein
MHLLYHGPAGRVESKLTSTSHWQHVAVNKVGKLSLFFAIRRPSFKPNCREFRIDEWSLWAPAADPLPESHRGRKTKTPEARLALDYDISSEKTEHEKPRPRCCQEREICYTPVLGRWADMCFAECKAKAMTFGGLTCTIQDATAKSSERASKAFGHGCADEAAGRFLAGNAAAAVIA